MAFLGVKDITETTHGAASGSSSGGARGKEGLKRKGVDKWMVGEKEGGA